MKNASLTLRETKAVGLPHSQTTAQTDLTVFLTEIVLVLAPDHLMSAAFLVLLFQLLKMNVLTSTIVQVAPQSDMSGHCRLLFQTVLLIV